MYCTILQGTEKTTLVMENVHLEVAQKFADLAPRYGVTCTTIVRGTGLCLTGLIDNIYNLRSEVDALLLWTLKHSTSSVPHPQHNVSPNPPAPMATGNVGSEVMYTVSSMKPVAPPPGIPAHVQQMPFQSPVSATSPHGVHPTTSSTATSAGPFNPRSPLRPPILRASVLPTPVNTAATHTHSSSHKPPALTSGNSPSDMAGPNREDFTTPPSSPTLPAPIVVYKSDGQAQHHPSTKDGAMGQPVTDDQAAGTSTHTESKSPPHSDAPADTPEDTPNDTPTDKPAEGRTSVFPNLNPDALALLQRLPEGDIPGVEYNTREGYVRILFRDECDADEAISKFQDAYKKVAVSHSRRLRAECVVIPAARSMEEVKVQIAKYEQMYLYCAFVLDKEKRQVRIISQSRQFEQAKQFFSEALQSPLATSASTMKASKAVANSLVVTLPNKRTLTLKRGNIVNEKADILVNAANGHLRHGGGVAGALNAASEGKLQQYCNKYMETKRKWKELPVGEVAVTHAGGNLKCQHVIHAVGPDGNTHSPSECERLVKMAIRNTLRAAERHNVTSVALPALSCGIFGVSKDLVAHSMIDAITTFTFTKPPPVLSDMRIVIIDEPTHSCFANHLEQLVQSSKRVSKNKDAATDHGSVTSKPSKNGGGNVPLADGKCTIQKTY